MKISSSFRRTFVGALCAFSVVAVASLTGCGSDDDTSDSAADSPSNTAPGYPLTVEHANGTTVIEERPSRIVTVGATDETVLVAFGVKPVGYAGWWGEDMDLSWPWSEDLWGDERPQLITTTSLEVNTEAVAALEPDLILGLWAGADDQQYETYSEIAPTVIMGTPEQQDVDWRDSTRLAGEILDEPDRAEQLIADLEARFEEVAAEHPEHAEASAAFVAPGADGSMWAYSPLDGRGQFLAGLGFDVNEGFADAFDEGRATLQVSNERYDVFDDIDCLFVSIDTPDLQDALADNRLYQSIRAVRNGCAVELLGLADNPPISAALATNNVLSLDYALDNVILLLEDVTIPS